MDTSLTILYYILMAIVMLLIIALMFIARFESKKVNPRYSLLDDILLFTGNPVAYGYFLFVCLNPSNSNPVATLDTPTSKIIAAWWIASSAIFLVRYYKNRKKH